MAEAQYDTWIQNVESSTKVESARLLNNDGDSKVVAVPLHTLAKFAQPTTVSCFVDLESLKLPIAKLSPEQARDIYVQYGTLSLDRLAYISKSILAKDSTETFEGTGLELFHHAGILPNKDPLAAFTTLAALNHVLTKLCIQSRLTSNAAESSNQESPTPSHVLLQYAVAKPFDAITTEGPVLLVGDPGRGKSHMARKLVLQWKDCIDELWIASSHKISNIDPVELRNTKYFLKEKLHVSWVEALLEKADKEQQHGTFIRRCVLVEDLSLRNPELDGAIVKLAEFGRRLGIWLIITAHTVTSIPSACRSLIHYYGLISSPRDCHRREMVEHVCSIASVIDADKKSALKLIYDTYVHDRGDCMFICNTKSQQQREIDVVVAQASPNLL